MNDRPALRIVNETPADRAAKARADARAASLAAIEACLEQLTEAAFVCAETEQSAGEWPGVVHELRVIVPVISAAVTRMRVSLGRGT